MDGQIDTELEEFSRMGRRQSGADSQSLSDSPGTAADEVKRQRREVSSIFLKRTFPHDAVYTRHSPLYVTGIMLSLVPGHSPSERQPQLFASERLRNDLFSNYTA
jgi:hypothetical protein